MEQIKSLRACLQNIFEDLPELVLPWPPSVNKYYKPHLGRLILSSEARRYQRVGLQHAMIQ